MGSRGLLARLASRSPERRIEPVESVVENLRSLLNMRVGSAVTVPTMGVPDFTDLVHHFPGSALTLTQTIRSTIMEFEPRLRHVMVRHVPSTDDSETLLVVSFEIAAQLVDGGAVRLRTEFARGGRVGVWPSSKR